MFVSPPTEMPTCLALIPARAGSKRVPNKNIRRLGDHPLLAYTIHTALASKVFSRVIVSTESPEIAEIAKSYGAEVPFLRPEAYAADHSPDIDWIRHLLEGLSAEGDTSECFSILRPTSPFRKPETLQRAWGQFLIDSTVDSLRAVEPCSQHPAKMWLIVGNRMTPVMENPNRNETPWHSQPYQSLPPVYAQNASLEIAWCRTVLEKGSIAGDVIMPFITEGVEGFDINQLEDWIIAEHWVQSQEVVLPKVRTLV